uniref:Uncharacterized protein n=1 Tax=Arundo donax TaxID=35708 RepID=A0A0A9GN28_ARUDO
MPPPKYKPPCNSLEDEAVEEEAEGGEEEDEDGEREEVVVRRVGLALPVHRWQELPRCRQPEPHRRCARRPAPTESRPISWSPVVVEAKRPMGLDPIRRLWTGGISGGAGRRPAAVWQRSPLFYCL